MSTRDELVGFGGGVSSKLVIVECLALSQPEVGKAQFGKRDSSSVVPESDTRDRRRPNVFETSAGR